MRPARCAREAGLVCRRDGRGFWSACRVHQAGHRGWRRPGRPPFVCPCACPRRSGQRGAWLGRGESRSAAPAHEQGEQGLVACSSAPRPVSHRTRENRVEAIAALRRLRFSGAELLGVARSTVSAVVTPVGAAGSRHASRARRHTATGASTPGRDPYRPQTNGKAEASSARCSAAASRSRPSPWISMPGLEAGSSQPSPNAAISFTSTAGMRQATRRLLITRPIQRAFCLP